jgi:hypothetical protein
MHHCLHRRGGLARLGTDWTVRESSPRRGEIFCISPDRLWCPPSLLYNGYRPGCGVDHPPQTSAEVKERVGLFVPILIQNTVMHSVGRT